MSQKILYCLKIFDQVFKQRICDSKLKDFKKIMPEYDSLKAKIKEDYMHRLLTLPEYFKKVSELRVKFFVQEVKVKAPNPLDMFDGKVESGV